MVFQPYSSVVEYSKTATDDLQFRLVNSAIWLSNANIHCITNNALYGNVTAQPATVAASDILVFEHFNLADLYFKNATAAANTTIYVVGITMSKEEVQKLLEV